MRAPALLLTLLACAPPDGEPSADTGPDASLADAVDPRTYLPIEDQAVRASVLVRGVRPSVQEIRAVRADPDRLPALVDRWLQEPGFGRTVRAVHDDALHMRSIDLVYPPAGPVAKATLQQMGAALAEEPLALIEHVVTSGQPYSAIVTSDRTVLDRRAAQIWSHHTYDPQGPDVQVVGWTDGRPAAGILSTNALWARHRSAGSNHHRGRAELVADALLCESFLGRDVPITGDVDLADEDAVAEALDHRPECVGCHQALDPLAAHLWTVHPEYTPAAVGVAYLGGCRQPFLELCYPFNPVRPAYELGRKLLQLRGPGYYGQASATLGDVGAALAADPRFARCAVQRLWSYAAQVPLDEVPFEVVAPLQQDFEASGLDYRALVRAVALHPDFRALDASRPEVADRIPGPLVVRPWQHAATIAQLTGFAFEVDVDLFRCRLPGLDLFCQGITDVATDATFGFRAITGGTDGARVLSPTHTPTPLKLLFAEALAEEAAAHVVARDLAQVDGALLGLVDRATEDEATVRAQLVELHAGVLAEVVPPDDEAIDATWTLWSTVRARTGDTRVAWRATLSALLQAPRLGIH
ncbi:MAG: hypothetical protein H6732_18145 [Alphaproteobacteria bacterium]|nr:hypothetical protein [Alphaproteobacteria bacterium]